MTGQFLVGLGFPRDLVELKQENLIKNPVFEMSNVTLPINNSKLKRIMDVVFSLILLFLCAPLMLLVCLFIKIDSPGPVFFKQWRAGRGAKVFVFINSVLCLEMPRQWSIRNTRKT